MSPFGMATPMKGQIQIIEGNKSKDRYSYLSKNSGNWMDLPLTNPNNQQTQVRVGEVNWRKEEEKREIENDSEDFKDCNDTFGDAKENNKISMIPSFLRKTNEQVIRTPQKNVRFK